jgi:hypothetical protein
MGVRVGLEVEVGIRVRVGVGAGVFVVAGVEVIAGAVTPQAGKATENTMQRRRANFGRFVFIFFSSKYE